MEWTKDRWLFVLGHCKAIGAISAVIFLEMVALVMVALVVLSFFRPILW